MGYDDGYYGAWPRYVPVAERRLAAQREVARLRKKGRVLSPVTLEGSRISVSWWGQAWCSNLESYSDYSNRMPRGRSYVRNGSVVDLQIERGRIRALVVGTRLYEIDIRIKPLGKPRWRKVVESCAGRVGSIVELLQGRFPSAVTEVLTHPGRGLFPKPDEIELGCTCPDWATMCKHVAAALYGVGARLDDDPELFFVLRNVDQMDLVGGAGTAVAPRPDAAVLENADLSKLFSIEMDATPALVSSVPQPSEASRRSRRGHTKKSKSLGEVVRREVAAQVKQSAAKSVRRRTLQIPTSTKPRTRRR